MGKCERNENVICALNHIQNIQNNILLSFSSNCQNASLVGLFYSESLKRGGPPQL